MHASPLLSLRLLLSPLVIATLLVAPCALAKKDLFATEPGAKTAPAAQQLAPTTNTPSEDPSTISQSEATTPSETTTQTLRADINKQSPDTKHTSKAKNEPSTLDTQLARLKRNLTKTKNDLFGSKDPAAEKKAVATSAIEPQITESASTEEEAKTEVATISATEAAQRAQTFAEGQVINVRKYSEDDQPRYAVKLLQKNGRMKTINLDAVNGTLIEEKPAEETPQ